MRGKRSMMHRLKAQVPYVIVLLISGYLYYRATQFDFVAPGERIGPDVWPKAILILSMLTCAYEIIKNLLFTRGGGEVPGVRESIIEEAPAEGRPAEQKPRDELPPRLSSAMLIAGTLMTLAYAAFINTLGFFICTVLFLAGFTLIGRYRRPGVIVAASIIGGLAFMYTFMKIVYVSLPLGVGPFEQLSVQLMQLMGIR